MLDSEFGDIEVTSSEDEAGLDGGLRGDFEAGRSFENPAPSILGVTAFDSYRRDTYFEQKRASQ